MRLFSQKQQKGFTLPELLITMGIFAVLVSITTINILYSQHRTSMTSAITMLVSDIKSQQIKAMIGDTEGRGTPDAYGIYFGTTSYTLFHGTSYSIADSANFGINLSGSLQFATPGATLIFNRLGGDVYNYSSLANTVIVKDPASGDQKTIQYNQYGVITSVQ